MPVSIREQILTAIGTAVNGEYNIPVPEDERDLPICVVADDDEVAEESPYGYSVITLPVVVARMNKAESDDRELMRAQAHELLASIITEMYTDETFGGLAQRISYTQGGIATEVGIVFAEASFAVSYETQRGNPYQQ